MCSGDDIMLEVPWCSSSLRKLDFTISPIPRVPSWMKSLVNIKELHLTIRILDQESLCVLGGLPVLTFLQLFLKTRNEDIWSADEQRLTVSRRCGFSSLRCFRISALSTWTIMPMLTFEAGSMPKLEVIRIDFNAITTISVTNGHLDFGLKHLSQLTKFVCKISGINSRPGVEAAIRKELGNNPNRPSFSADDYYCADDFSSLHQKKKRDLGTRFTDSTSDDDDADPQLSAAVLPLPTYLSFTMDHDGSRRGQQGHRAKTRQGKARQALPCINTISGGGLVQGIADGVKGTSGGPTSGLLEPPLIAAQQQALVPPCFILNARPSDAEAIQQAPGAQSPPLSSWGLNAFSSLSLRNDEPTGPGFSATAAEGASHTGATTSHGLGPGLIAAPQQTTSACFTFNAGSSNLEKHALASYEPSLCVKPSHHEVAATVVESTFDAGSSYQEGSRLEE